MPSLRTAGRISSPQPLRVSLPPLRARLALLAGAIFSAAVLILASFSLWREREEDLHHARSNAANLGQALAQQLDQSFGTIDLGLDLAIRQLRDQQAPRHEGASERVLQLHADLIPTITAIGLYGPQGERLAGSTPEPSVLPTSIAATDLLLAHRTGKANGLNVSAPTRTMPQGPWRILLSRRVGPDHAALEGIIAAVLDPQKLAETYRSINLGAGAAVLLTRSDGMLVAAYPWREELIGKVFGRTLASRDPSVDEPNDVASSKSLFGANVVAISSNPLREFPLTLTVMLDARAVLAEWRKHVVIEGTGALLVSALSLALGLLLDRHLRRREESVAQLRANQEELTEAQRIARLGNWHMDASSGGIELSAEAARLLDLSAQALPTLASLLERVCDEDRSRVSQAWNELKRLGALDVQFRTAAVAGNVRWLHARAEARGLTHAKGLMVRGTLIDVTDERRAEHAVEHLAAVVESTGDAILTISSDGRILSWNRAADRMFGYCAQDAIGRHLTELLPAHKATRAVRLVARSAAGETIEGIETKLTPKSQRALYIAVTLSPLRDAPGRFAAASAVVRDVTARRETERRRRTEHRVSQLLAESAPLAVTMPRILETLCRALALDCGVYRVSDGAGLVSSLHAWSTGTPALRALTDTLSTPRLLAPSTLYWRTANTRRLQWENELPARLEGCLRSKFAAAGAVAAVSVPVLAGSRFLGALQFFGHSNNRAESVLIEGMQTIGHQVGQFIERKRVEAAQREADERLRNIAANMPGVVFEYRLRPDGAAAFEFVSEGSIDILEERPEALIRDPRMMFRLVEPGYRRQLLRSMRISRENRTPWISELPIRTRSGRVRWVRGQSLAKDLDDGSVVWDGVIVDVTAQKQAEQAIQQMNEQLERRVAERTAQLSAANRELESFAYSVSHDLRAPLRSIEGFSRIVVEEYGPKLEPIAADYLARVRNASERMGHLIDDLLALSRVTRSELKRVRTDLSALGATIVQDLRAESPERSVDVSIHPSMSCMADPSLMRIALYNLIGNAWKFTSRRANASIEFGALTQRGRTVYYVRDNGAGFEMSHAGKLFVAFQRLHSHREFEGTGVGLATVSRIVDRHGGAIWAESVPDHGATFYFTLTGGSALP